MPQRRQNSRCPWDDERKVAGPPFVRKKLESQARRFSAARLAACLDAIHETDLAIKGASSLPAELSVERLVLALAS